MCFLLTATARKAAIWCSYLLRDESHRSSKPCVRISPYPAIGSEWGKSDPIRKQLGLAWHASGRPDAIVSTYQSLLDESIESKAGSKIDVDYAEAYIDGLQAGGGSIDWFKSRQNVVVAFSEYLQELGRIEEAIQLYKDWLDRDGGGRHRSELCQLLIKSNRSDEAVQIYRDALAKSPNDGDP